MTNKLDQIGVLDIPKIRLCFQQSSHTVQKIPSIICASATCGKLHESTVREMGAPKDIE